MEIEKKGKQVETELEKAYREAKTVKEETQEKRFWEKLRSKVKIGRKEGA